MHTVTRSSNAYVRGWPSAGGIAPNCEVATLVVVKVRGLWTKILVADLQDPFQANALQFPPDTDALECVCSRLAKNPFFKDLTASTEHEPAAGTKRKLTSSSRPICKSMPKIGAGDCSKDVVDVRHAVQVYGSAYTTPRAPSDRPVSRCTERFCPRTHTSLQCGCQLDRGTQCQEQ